MIGWLARIAVFAPIAAFAWLGLARLLGRRASERSLTRLVSLTFVTSVIAALGLAGAMILERRSSEVVPLGTWFSSGTHRVHLSLLVDGLSVPFLVLSSVLCGTVGAFATRYLHQDPGFHRFMALMLLFAGGIQLVTAAGGLDLAYIGWELVGITSALLIAYYQNREAPVHHGLWAFGVYRACDVGLLLAGLVAHARLGSGAYPVLYGAAPWPAGAPGLAGDTATLVAFLLLLSAMGKSAQVPLSGWLPRAMEGPTPSSAIFYGALSVHAGCYILLRAAPLLDQQPGASAALVVVGLVTALYATVVGRAQTDIKSTIAYATLTQLGIIFAEIGLGLRLIPLVHIMGHACLRALQFLRAPSLLHERHQVEAAMGEHVTRTGAHLERHVPASAQLWLYRFALQRGYLDALIMGWVVGPVLRALAWLDRLERKWIG
ncbi:MAG: proton-conducting transporter membrane subunit [Sorangiineae bacterium]|nr:proton-conducting transporter membrane subunit [Polyangiaceae bacterium]MEB2322536.1 proton-conducting transporter membrane subunit [Sorangiineae bacterium]